MKSTDKQCEKCGAELESAKIQICPNCGAKRKKAFYKKWWFWLIVVVGVIAIAAAGGGSDEVEPEQGNVETNESGGNTTNNSGSGSSTKNYEVVDLQTMLNDLENNAMKAESTYQNKYVEVKGRIVNFDSDGSYISIEPVNADEWNFDTVMCYIKNDSQRSFLMEKSVGDVVTIKGKVISIGEVLGYSINIDEIK